MRTFNIEVLDHFAEPRRWRLYGPAYSCPKAANAHALLAIQLGIGRRPFRIIDDRGCVIPVWECDAVA